MMGFGVGNTQETTEIVMGFRAGTVVQTSSIAHCIQHLEHCTVSSVGNVIRPAVRLVDCVHSHAL